MASTMASTMAGYMASTCLGVGRLEADGGDDLTCYAFYSYYGLTALLILRAYHTPTTHSLRAYYRFTYRTLTPHSLCTHSALTMHSLTLTASTTFFWYGPAKMS